MFAIIYRDQFHDQGLSGFSDQTNNVAVTRRFDVISVNLKNEGGIKLLCTRADWSNHILRLSIVDPIDHLNHLIYPYWTKIQRVQSP
jgi:hypothetical protein